MKTQIFTLVLAGTAFAAYAGTTAPAVPKMPPASAEGPTVTVKAPRLLPASEGLGLTGGVQVRLPGETVSGDSVIFSAKAHKMTFLGNVRAKTERGETLRAQRLVLRVPAGTFRVPKPSAVQKSL